MISQSLQKIIIIALTLFVVAFVGYRLFTMTPDASLSTDLSSPTTEVAGQDILTLVEKLKLITIDESVFSSPTFSNLKDFSSEITPEAQGRVNPFAGIGNDSSQFIQPNKSTTTSAR
jgi:hypothetical protein